MTQQINYTTLEQCAFSPARKVLEKPLKVSFKGKSAFSEEFLQELDAYIERNYLLKSSPVNIKNTHCLRCLKAHALSLAKKHGLQGSVSRYLEKSMPGKAGHDGYYLDGNDLISLSKEEKGA